MRNIVVLVVLFACTALQAAGWGARGTPHTFEGAEWKDVYYQVSGISFTGALPNYAGTELVNDQVFMAGRHNEYAHVIHVFNGLDPKRFPKTGKQYKKELQKGNPGVELIWVDAKKIGAKYAIKFSVDTDGKTLHFLCISTKKHLVELITDDTNEARRNHFFDSFHIQ